LFVTEVRLWIKKLKDPHCFMLGINTN
jgi:hypothetical protein